MTDSSVCDKTKNRDKCLCIAILDSGFISKADTQKQAITKKISKTLGNIPFTIWSITSFPRTKSGKIQRLKSISDGKKIFE